MGIRGTSTIFTTSANSSQRRGSAWKRTVAPAVCSLAILGAAGEARALPVRPPALGCSLCGSSWGLPTGNEIQLAIGFMTSVPVLTGGIVTGGGSATAAMDRKPSRGWFISSYVLGGLNLFGAAAWGSIAAEAERDDVTVATTFAIAHAAVATLDILAPSIGLAIEKKPRVLPIAVGGRDAGGQPWSGVGLAVFDF